LFFYVEGIYEISLNLKKKSKMKENLGLIEKATAFLSNVLGNNYCFDYSDNNFELSID